ncbi:cytochrome c-type biogenesis protein CcmH [Saccharibacter sp. 17.LH.SD]|nr:cytochrome c-type biogenesis protein [Saccharibacter sp. 17.LH.SD]MXV43949.1 cytochrome c-type biogenesis protein CcmH [Saccharibacter sp. 17.LH.SD]
MLMAFSHQAWSVESPRELLPNPQQEAQAEEVGRQLRCLVCQNESIEDSSAPLARDLRQIVRQQVSQGRTSHDILKWMTHRYGDFIRLKPVFDRGTALLWLMPILSLGGALLLARRLWRRRHHPLPLPPLSGEEKARLHKLLTGD